MLPPRVPFASPPPPARPVGPRRAPSGPVGLQAGLLLGTAEGKDLHVAQAFGPEVAAMLAALEAPWPRMVKDLKAPGIARGFWGGGPFF